MSVEKLGEGKYLVRWRDSAGRSRSKTVYRQRDANTLDGELKRKKSMGDLISHERGDIELRDFWDIFWANYAMPNTSPRTQDVYMRLWRTHIQPEFGTRRLRSITSEQVSAFVGKLGKKLAPGSVIRVLALLRNALQRAVEWRYIADNPATHVKRPKANHRRGRALTADELSALCLELGERSGSIAYVLAHTGLRPGELRALRWCDLRPGAISVTRAASSNQIGPTKTGKTRSVAIRDEARKELRAWYVLYGRPKDDDLIYPSRDGKLWSYNAYSLWVNRKFGPAASRAGLKGLRPYDLRHTFVSTLIEEGHNLKWIAQQAGHSLGVLCDTYAHLLGGESVLSECDANASVLEILRATGRS